MPTGKQLRKWASAVFTPAMKDRGFTLVEGTRFAYVRQQHDICQMIAFQQSQWSPIAYVNVRCAVIAQQMAFGSAAVLMQRQSARIPTLGHLQTIATLVHPLRPFWKQSTELLFLISTALRHLRI